MGFARYIFLLTLSGLLYALDTSWNGLPPFGKFLDPYHGCWQNTKEDQRPHATYTMPGLSAPVEVRMDERLVPHIFARHETDAIFMQGYLHAKYRLWQMDMTARLAGGRLSEVAGSKTLDKDREMRRKGMVYAAAIAVKTFEANPESKRILEAYVAGVNAWISSLSYASYPLEYKLMDFKPEPWTPLKTGLMVKFMADKLSGRVDDFELTLAKTLFPADFDQLYPQHEVEEYPVIGEKDLGVGRSVMGVGRSMMGVGEVNVGDFGGIMKMINGKLVDEEEKTEGIGSNNWAVSASKSASGHTILCNDPHLPFNLPAIWYENQLTAPGLNVYGVSLPGAPQVIIGFNDSISWGVTNGYRDVKDFMEVQFTDATRTQYRVHGKNYSSDRHVEVIKVKGHPDFRDIVVYTPMGIVMYDASYPLPGYANRNFAMKWMAHEPSNELIALMGINHARNYTEFTKAVANFACPHQNFAFTSVSGDIAMWSQGRFYHKETGEGRFLQSPDTIMHGWHQALTQDEVPHELNPPRGFVMSANQVNTGPHYPFYYNGIFYEGRSKRLTQLLSLPRKFSLRDMMRMQQDVYWQNAADLLPTLLKTIDTLPLTSRQRGVAWQLMKWDFQCHADSREAIFYDLWFHRLQSGIYDDEFGRDTARLNYPKERVTIALLNQEAENHFFDDVRTTKVESKADLILRSFREMCSMLDTLQAKTWYAYKNTTARHLSRIDAFSVPGIRTGGGKGMVNASATNEGPSWRMIVQMSDPPQAFGIYPGGQSGNPGSRYYTSMITDWAEGKYYPLHFARKPEDIP